MEKNTEKLFSLFQKLASHESFLLLIGLILLSDIYLIVSFEKTIFLISIEWITENITIGDFLLFFLLFSSIYGLIIPCLNNLIEGLIPSSIPETSKWNEENQISLSDLLHLSIIENNSPAYQHY